MSERSWWVQVNETHLMQHTDDAVRDWWFGFRYLAYGRTDRIRIIAAGLIGDTALVACSDKEHAEWVHRHMLDRGVPKSAAKVRSFRVGEEPAAIEVALVTTP